MKRVVVIGNGMAGSRLTQRLIAASETGTGQPLSITLVGAEKHPAYNRILLSEILNGRARKASVWLHEPAQLESAGVDLRLGTAAAKVDRDQQVVHLADGSVVGYDYCVLATGSRPFLPPIPGLLTADGQLRPGAMTFRTIDDCDELLARSQIIRSVVVVGGGLLGIEAAKGLAGRGTEVTLIHASAHLMERQLDSLAGRIVAAALERTGIKVLTSSGVASVQGDDLGIEAITTPAGQRIGCDLVVVACGVAAETGLAQAAGLTVKRGIVVDESMRSVTDPAVLAIGECAEYDGQVYGLVAPAWEQADVAARTISANGLKEQAGGYTGSNLVTQLKAPGLSVMSMGEVTAELIDSILPLPAAEPGTETEVVQVADPVRLSYRKLVVRNERLVGAILVGDTTTGGALAQYFDRQAPLPPDRLAALIGGRSEAGLATDPTRIPDRATICRCNGVTKAQITTAYLAGSTRMPEMVAATGATTGCGGCREAVAGIVDWLVAAEPDPSSTPPTKVGTSPTSPTRQNPPRQNSPRRTQAITTTTNGTR